MKDQTGIKIEREKTTDLQNTLLQISEPTRNLSGHDTCMHCSKQMKLNLKSAEESVFLHSHRALNVM